MNNLNFRTLENLKAPDALKEKLLAIPESAPQKPVAAPLWRKRAFMTAASLLFITALSVTVYFLFGNKPNTAVPIKTASTEVIRQTSATDASVSPESSTTNVHERQNSTLSTEASTEAARISATAPTQRATQGSTAPTSKPSPTENTPTAPTTKPTATENIKPPVRPTEPPVPQPTEPQERPTEEPPTEPEELPTEPEEPPTAAPWAAELEITVWLPTGDVPEDGLVYCKVISVDSGKIYGDFGDYDDERLMVSRHIGEAYCSFDYDCGVHFNLPHDYEADECVIYVYDSKGNVLLTDYTTLGTYY